MPREEWYVDGEPLLSYAYGVQAVTEGHGIPPARGTNVVVPFRHGAKPFTKFYGERNLSLAMYVVGADPDGGVPTSDAALAELYGNLDRLRELFGRRTSLLALRRVMPNGETRTAEAEVAGTMDFDNVRGASARFVVEMLMPDPFWYGVEQVDQKWYGVPVYGMSGFGLDFKWLYGEGHLYGTTWTEPTSWTVNHPGNFETSNLQIQIKGAVKNPRITHSNGSYVEVLVTTTTAQTLLIDCDAFTATLDGSSVIGSLRHSGDPAFFKLLPGDNVLSISSDTTPRAAVTVTFNPRYL